MARKSSTGAPASIQAAYEQQMGGTAPAVEQESTGGGPEPSVSADGQVTPPADTGNAPPEEAVESLQSAPGSADTKPDPIVLDGVDLSEYNLPPEALEAIKKGTLRQADYTRKTQAAAELRKKAEELDNFKTYLQDNPHVAQAIRDASLIKPGQTNGVAASQEPKLPDKPLEEMNAEEQFQYLEVNLGKRLANQFIGPLKEEIQNLRSELHERDTLSSEDRELIEAHFPGEHRLPDTEELKMVNDLRMKVPQLSKRQLYEMVMAQTWQEQALKASHARTGNEARRAAASVAKPGNAAASEAIPDVRKAKNSKSAWGEATQFALRKHGHI